MKKRLIMKNSKFNGMFGAFFAVLLGLGLVGCEKENGVVPQDRVVGAAEAVIADADLLTPEGYKLVPFSIALEVKAHSYFDAEGPDDASPFAVTISGEGYSAEIGYVKYFERFDTRPKNGIVQGEGRIELKATVVQRCIPDAPAYFFQTFPQEIWQPLPIGSFQISAPVLIKGGLVEFEGAFGQATRTVTFIEGLLDKGIGQMEGFVYIPDEAAQ